MDRIAITSAGQLLVAFNAVSSDGTAGLFSSFLGDGLLHDFIIRRTGTTVDVLVDGVVIDTVTNSNNFSFDSIASQWGGATGVPFWSGIIADVNVTDVSTLIRKYNTDEDWIGPSTVLVDSSGNGQDGTAVNITDVDALNYVFEGELSPNTWTDVNTGLIVIDVAGT